MTEAAKKSGHVYKCTECAKTFERQDSHMTHILLHAGSKKNGIYNCVVCLKNFKKQSDLVIRFFFLHNYGSFKRTLFIVEAHSDAYGRKTLQVRPVHSDVFFKIHERRPFADSRPQRLEGFSMRHLPCGLHHKIRFKNAHYDPYR